MTEERAFLLDLRPVRAVDRQGVEWVPAAVLDRVLADCHEQIAAKRAHEADIGRRMYRRGYTAGHSAASRGAAVVTNPERHARGELRALLTEGKR